jgi:hypothetical protein
MLWTEYPSILDEVTLEVAYETLQGDPPSKIPFLVWMLENPASPCPLPGNIDLRKHDYIHLLLKRGFTSSDEAFIVGFTMGNDTRTAWFHLLIFKVIGLFLYPPKYRISYTDLEVFDRGVEFGRSMKMKNLNQICWNRWNHKTLSEIGMEIY